MSLIFLPSFFSSSSFNPIRHGIRIDLYAVQIGFIRARFLAIYPIAGYDNKLEILWNYNVTITSLADFNFDRGGDVKGITRGIIARFIGLLRNSAKFSKDSIDEMVAKRERE